MICNWIMCGLGLRIRRRCELIHGAVRLSANVIARRPEEFVSQMVGRLLPHQGTRCGCRVYEGCCGRRATALAETFVAVSSPARHRSAAHAGGPLSFCPWRGGDAGRAARGVRVWGQHAEGVGPGERPRAAHAGGPLSFCPGVAVTPDGRRAVSASRDNTLKVWDLESGRELRTLEGHSDSVYGVAVTPDGRRAVSASGDKTLKVWDLESGARAAHAGGPLSFCQWRGGDAGRAARGLRVWGQHAEGVGPGKRPRAAHAGGPLSFCLWRGGDAGRAARGLRVWGQNAEGVGPGKRPRAAHAGGPLSFCRWRGGDAGRAARGLRVWGQNAEGVGPGKRRASCARWRATQLLSMAWR